MIISNADLLQVAVAPKQYPDEKVPEIAFAGRSNVGKSSLINLLTNRRKLARTSSSPGKTRTINFFDINKGMFRIVDLPGYGYAKVSKSESEKWGNMIENYLKKRPNLISVIQLVDIRHKPSLQDLQMHEWIDYYGKGSIVVATKADKLSRNVLNKNISQIRKTLKLKEEYEIIPVSTLKKTGLDKLLTGIDNLLGV